MTALARALDIPDEEPRSYRGVMPALLASIVWLAVGVALARTFALGGMVRSHLLVGLVVVVPTMVIAWLAVGPSRWRTASVVVAMVVGLALMPLASHGATPSPARLQQVADAIGLPGKTVRDRTAGTGRCRPICSELHRRSVVDGVSFVKARAQVIGILKARQFAVTESPTKARATRGRLAIQVTLTQTSLDRTTVNLDVFALGPTPAHSVG